MNSSTSQQNKEARIITKSMLVAGGIVGVWAMSAMGFALSRVDWQIGELLRQYLVSIGLVQDFETLVDFYTHIKGVEYIICLAFLGAFPAFFKYLNREKSYSTQ